MLDWIMTIPGLLITSGVVLLILAIILFIIGNKKGKTAKVVETTSDAPAPEAISTDTISTDSEPVVEETAPVVENNEVTPANGVINFTPEVETPVEETAPVVEEASEPVVEETPAIDTTPVEASAPAVEMPVVEETAPAVEPVAEEPAVTIYGGNDPLENTQTVAPVTEAVPYGGAPEVNVVETPAVEESAPAVEMPVVEPVVETPVAPTVDIPAVEPTPVVAEPTVEIPAQPAIEIPEPTITTDNTNM